MYRLLPWRLLGTALAVVVAFAVYADDFGAITGIVLPDQLVVRYLPLISIMLLTAIFGSAGRWAPWRCIWRIFPFLNKFLFPDLNGVWLGSSSSNWPTIKKMFDVAQTNEEITQDELHSIPERADAMAVEIKASLFKIQVTAGLSATNGLSHSIIVRPRRGPHGSVHLTYMYEQKTPHPAMTDVETHFGAAELIFNMGDFDTTEGIYWTRRNWKMGLNTAGRLELRRINPWKNKDKTLRQYAAEEMERMASRS